jgi:hypothetical protein
MEMQAVTSTDVSEIGYDYESATLRIRFLKGGILYDYYNVPEEIYLGLMNAPSIGQYLNVYIKKGGYPYAKI